MSSSDFNTESNQTFEGVALQGFNRLVCITHGADVADTGAINKRLYDFYAKEAIHGVIPKSRLSLSHFADLAPCISIMDIKLPTGNTPPEITADKVKTRYMGSKLDQVYGQRTGKKLSSFADSRMIYHSVASIKMITTHRTILTGGALYERPSGDVVLQATYLPVTSEETGTEDSVVDRVMIHVERRLIQNMTIDLRINLPVVS